MEDYPEKEELEDVSLDELSEYTEDQPLLLGMVMSLFMVFQPKKEERTKFQQLKDKFLSRVDQRIERAEEVMRTGEQAKREEENRPGAAGHPH
ncbi:MAG: hypothetical protein MRY78_20205 [Saprospiraceae bacterium]|nr:hypothetical protein [Saprospiraceae bacterium]